MSDRSIKRPSFHSLRIPFEERAIGTKRAIERMSSKDLDESARWSPIEGDGTLTWAVTDRFYTPDNVRVLVRKAAEDPKAVMYVLKTPDGKRYLLQRTKNEIILLASDTRTDTFRFIACEHGQQAAAKK
ncbi:hypothetical protein M3Y99_00973100 [Aphelenchoides fujianensis]|nr:hypothetical protein M3Y99_00973100 [Aphelenchoides fujianensis]